MGFFDEYRDIGGEGGTFISAEEKEVLMSNGIPFTITGLAQDEGNKYGPRYVAFILVPNVESGEEEERKISFPVGSNVESRDRMLREMEAYFKSEDAEAVQVKLEKKGQAILIRPAQD